ncbi:MAG: DUF998 domain-containing protein [Thermoplasmatales archaeon]|nr:MAG: DUF998 domain-containing protein [Thermoplasmatales archaeon]
MLSAKIVKFSGGCGILILIVFLTSLFLSIQQAPWFSWTENAISDLGKQDAVPSIFNNGLIVTGILLLLFSVGLSKELKERHASPLFFGLSSIFLIGVGLIPLPSIYHVLVSVLFFVAFTYAFFAFGFLFFKDATSFLRNKGIFAIFILIIISISAIFLLFLEGVAIPEMMVMVPGFFWCVLFGSKMVSSKP